MKPNVAPVAAALPEPRKVFELPREVAQAKAHDWGVFVDAFLMNAARVGDRYAATVFCDQSGIVSDGTTVATRSVRQICGHGDFKLLQTFDGADHYVLVTEHLAGGKSDGQRS
ncbi:hypothetical protein ALP33_01202 [Pseudomonas amygdali pv. lachrymans]|uniref:Uncharacterized protein n=1 Tax=Pseudomonas amygdali pv. lachrymans TaxID=53707 RepID=A0AB37RAU6_PSEAV|nr:hypothetical protein [Pseudomonas amygdali]RMU22181.1 hypothetical protein ALP33_01202 [Pseudomonas amygdali pv. lachrymans]